METKCEAVAAVGASADAIVAREAAVALNEQAATEMETECARGSSSSSEC